VVHIQTLIMLANMTNPGGALGWKKRGDLDPTFEEAAFTLEASTTSNPKYVEVKTGFGYHIIMVEGRK
jgi:NIMA-interacting peptidyl-prolyl cis-trans isomerase 4